MADRGGTDARHEIAMRYVEFGERDARGSSPAYEAWALGLAADTSALARLAELTRNEQQPNRIFAAARWIGVEPDDGYAALARAIESRWEELRSVVRTRSTQTNEAGRCAVLLPLLASIPGPVALLEVGASAGLCLYPDRYSYRYSDGVRLDPESGPSTVVLDCAVHGSGPVPTRLPDVVWRAGIDLNPVDVADLDATRWLENLVWPGHTERLDRLRRALAVVAEDPPQLHRGDLNQALPVVAAQAPTDATLVVFHSAVLTYLSPDERARFVATVHGLPGHWISNEGREVLDIAVPATAPLTADTHFTVALDGQAVALANGHAHSITWLEDRPPGRL